MKEDELTLNTRHGSRRKAAQNAWRGMEAPAKLVNALPASAFEKRELIGWARPLLHVSYVTVYKFSV